MDSNDLLWLFAQVTPQIHVVECVSILLIHSVNTIFFFSAPFELMIAMDGSDSLTRSEYNTALSFIQSIIQSLPISSNGVQAGMIEYSDRPNLRIPLNQQGGKTGLVYRIQYTPASRGAEASTPEMIELATKEAFSKEQGARPGVPKYLLVITDDSITPSEDLKHAVSKAEQAGINTYVVNIGDQMNAEGLRLLAPVPRNRYTVNDVASLKSITDELVKNILKDVAESKYITTAYFFSPFKYISFVSVVFPVLIHRNSLSINYQLTPVSIVSL